MSLLIIFIAMLFLHGLVSARLARTAVTAPIVFTGAGMVALALMPQLRAKEGNPELFLTIAEIGLVLLLFADASHTDRRLLRSIRTLPARLLSTGMLLTILLGGLAALVVFRQLSIWEAGILAAILAPTDAGLGQIIVNSPRVPLKIRQALNVEAGLNDGLSVPFLLFFMALAEAGSIERSSSLTRYIIEQLGYGALLGVGIGLIGGWLLGVAHRRGWIDHAWRQYAVIALPFLCLIVSHAIGASPFIAAFVAGMAVQVGFKEAGESSVEFTEEWGQFLNMAVFYLFGLFVARSWPQFGWTHALYAVLSLTVVRMVPVAIALRGTRLSRTTVLFMGWFGPRGLASIVLGLVFLEEGMHGPGEVVIQLAVMATVLLSIFAHGLSALPGTQRYARHVESLPAEAPERS